MTLALLGLLLVTGVGLLAPHAAADTTSTTAVPPAGGCPTGVTNVVGGRTVGPVPLPAPTSTRGGRTLSTPGLHVDLPGDTPRPPKVPATAWVVVDVSAGTVIASCNAHVPLAPASTLKILTTLALAHELDWNTTYVGKPDAPATDGSKVGILTGGTYTVKDLFHGLMLSSGNDAATALTTVAGGPERTAALMNARARALGAEDTHAVNASGLDASGQVSSAYDLALLGRALLDDPLLARLVTTRSYAFPGATTEGRRSTFQIQNHNRLLESFPGATGVKNGYTNAAGGSFVGSATRGDRTYLVTVLRAEGYTHRVAAQLLTWAFESGAAARPVGTLEEPTAVTASSTTGAVSAIVSPLRDNRPLSPGSTALAIVAILLSAVALGLWRMSRITPRSRP